MIHLVGTTSLTGSERRTAFISIVKEMLSDGELNWGRVATLYAFTARISKQIYEKDGSREVVNEYINYLAEAVDTQLEHRIQTCLGGWVY